MRHVAPAAALCAVLITPAIAQEASPVPEGEAEGLSLMEEGARMIFRGLMDEMAPVVDEMEGFAGEVEPALRSFAAELGPALMELRGLIDEIGNYEAPEILPNGDIIIRRSPDAPPYVAPEGEVEL